MTDIVERVEKVMEEVEHEHPLTFAALVMPSEDETFYYDLIVSSPWFLQEGKARSYDYLREKLSKQLNKEDWHQFNRVLLMNPDDRFVQELTKEAERYNNRDFSNLRAAGIGLRYAHIFAAHTGGSPVQLRSFA